jgi:hypothetical protein
VAPAHHVTPASLKVRFYKGGWDVLDFGPFFVFVLGWVVPVYDTLDQKMRLAKPTLKTMMIIRDREGGANE